MGERSRSFHGIAPMVRHDPAKWDGFRKKYFEELDRNKEAVSHLSQLARKGKVTLLYAARDTEHNEAGALKGYLLQHASS